MIRKLGHLLMQRDVPGDMAQPILGVSVATGVRERSVNDGRPAPSLDLSKYKSVDPGDIVMNALGKPHGSIGRSPVSGITSPAYWVLRPSGEIDGQFAHHLLRSRWMISRLTGLGKNQPPNQFDISWEVFRHIEVKLPQLDEQRRIADFLDDRVSRIARIIAARREQVELAHALPWQQFAEELAGVSDLPIRRAISSLSDGPFGSAFSSGDYVESGPAVIRLGNIGFGEFRDRDLARVPEAIYRKFPGSHVRPGELLIASLGDARNHAGRACVSPEGLDEAMVKGKCYRASANRSVAQESFLAILLSSPIGADALVQQGAGATRSMLNFERLLSCRLPIPSVSRQESLIDMFGDAQRGDSTVIDALTHTIDLLTEYKSSLITAAVTGQLDVTTAGSTIPE